jgi:hypothetical protein
MPEQGRRQRPRDTSPRADHTARPDIDGRRNVSPNSRSGRLVRMAAQRYDAMCPTRGPALSQTAGGLRRSQVPGDVTEHSMRSPEGTLPGAHSTVETAPLAFPDPHSFSFSLSFSISVRAAPNRSSNSTWHPIPTGSLRQWPTQSWMLANKPRFASPPRTGQARSGALRGARGCADRGIPPRGARPGTGTAPRIGTPWWIATARRAGGQHVDEQHQAFRRSSRQRLDGWRHPALLPCPARPSRG